MQQRDIARFVIKTITGDALTVATRGAQFAVTGYQARDMLNRSTLFAKLKECFDQFKINAIKVRIVQTDFVSVDNATLASALAWDRNGAAVANLTYDTLCSYGSTKTNYYTLNSKTVQNHWIAAETIGEKTAYIPTTTPTVQDPAIWDPYFLMGICGPAQLGDGEQYHVGYTIEWSFDVTFRGVRTQLAQQ